MDRPTTAVRERFDASFLSALVTPAHPSYPSGHATVSGTAAAVLTAFFPGNAKRLHEQAERRRCRIKLGPEGMIAALPTLSARDRISFKSRASFR